MVWFRKMENVSQGVYLSNEAPSDVSLQM